jgi:hypothetical protein
LSVPVRGRREIRDLVRRARREQVLYIGPDAVNEGIGSSHETLTRDATRLLPANAPNDNRISPRQQKLMEHYSPEAVLMLHRR